MAKFSTKSKLPQKEMEGMIMDLCVSIAELKNPKEAAQLLSDLLGRQELEMVAKRLKVAGMLLNEHTYDDIRKALKISPPTIARVQSWLQEAGAGYRLVLERSKRKKRGPEIKVEAVALSGIKRKYPMYFWPQLLLERMVKNASAREKAELKSVLNQLGKKRHLYAQLDKLL